METDKPTYRKLYDKKRVNLAGRYKCPKCGYQIFKVWPRKWHAAGWHLKCANPTCNFEQHISSEDWFDIRGKRTP